MTTTIYDVMIRFGIKDKKANKGIRGLQGTADKAYGAMKRLAILTGAGFGMSSLLKHTIGYNRELTQTKAGLATVIDSFQQIGRGNALQRAGTLMAGLRNDAKKSAGTFQDMTDFSKNIAAPILAAGGSMEQLRDLTKGGVVAAHAFGIEAGVAALDIRQALGKGLNKRDPFGSMLLDSVKMTTEAFNKLDKASRMKTLLKAFDTPAIKAAAKEYETSFEGTFSTFKSGLQELGGTVGKELFSNLSKELVKINAWFTSNSDKVAVFASDVASAMLSAFSVAKEVFGFLFEHRDLLMTLAKAMLIGKAGGFLAGPLMGFSKALSGNTGTLNKSTSALGKFVGGLGSLIQAGGVGYAVGTFLDGSLDLSDRASQTGKYDNSPQGIKKTHDDTEKGRLLDRIAQQQENVRVANIKIQQARDTDNARRFGTLGKDEIGSMQATALEKYKSDFLLLQAAQGQLNSLNSAAKAAEEMEKSLGGLFDVQAAYIKDVGRNFVMSGIADGEGTVLSTNKDTPKNKGNRQTINIHMEVASDDPDRFVVGLEDYFERANTSPSQAASALRK